ncbi:unnamed protein product [Bursaphelenchus okinawaensis]|uniref:Uncharacterized protein n=1 Tax=Bursaphelenchus okinawaensis TaxID=465554 RepID=A0A811KY76_9BILA|nr:unnamed protein product [Bursaphelenchus okinawaensis]CAG9114146.1 unnamed protein product [Bursaphelenchus okinawaensis]
MLKVEIKSGQMYLITLGIFEHMDRPYNKIAGCLYISALYVLILTLAIQFLYRYYALCDTCLTLPKLFVLYFGGILLCFLEGFAGMLLFRDMNDEDTMKIREHPMYTDGDVGYMTVDTNEIGAIYHTIMTQFFMILVYGIVYYTNKKIKAHYQNANFDGRTKRAHQRLSRLMIIQLQ